MCNKPVFKRPGALLMKDDETRRKHSDLIVFVVIKYRIIWQNFFVNGLCHRKERSLNPYVLQVI